MRRTPLPPGTLDATDKTILTVLQEGFPVEPSPFEIAGRDMGLEESELLSRLGRLREVGAITRFGPFFDAAAMGGDFCLCAMEVPGNRFDEVVESVNAHPEVAHNYERNHKLNMWFVLATERPEEIKAIAQQIERETGIEVLLFPKLKEFYINFRVAL